MAAPWAYWSQPEAEAGNAAARPRRLSHWRRRRRLGRPGHRRLLAELGHRVVARDIVAGRSRRCSRGEVTIHGPGIEELLERNADRLHLHTEWRSCSPRRGCSLSASTRRRPPRRRGSFPRPVRRRELPGATSTSLVMKSTVPAGTGRGDPPRPAGLPTSPAPSSSRRARRSRTSSTRTGSCRRRPRRRGGRRAVAALYAPLGGEVVQHRRGQRRDDEARLQRLPGHEDLLHQRDRQRLRRGRRRRHARWARGMGLDERIGPTFLGPGSATGDPASPRMSGAEAVGRQLRYHFQLLTR